VAQPEFRSFRGVLTVTFVLFFDAYNILNIITFSGRGLYDNVKMIWN